MYKRILVADDGGEPGAAALDEAVNLVKTDGGALRVVLVVQRPVPFGPAIIDPAAARKALHDEARKLLERAARRAGKAGVQVSTQLVDADKQPVAKALLDEAQTWGADLIVMGTHGRRGVDHFMLGSVAEAVLRGTALPVLLLRTAPR